MINCACLQHVSKSSESTLLNAPFFCISRYSASFYMKTIDVQFISTTGKGATFQWIAMLCLVHLILICSDESSIWGWYWWGLFKAMKLIIHLSIWIQSPLSSIHWDKLPQDMRIVWIVSFIYVSLETLVFSEISFSLHVLLWNS